MNQNRLRELEDLCIQECAPPCTAACPVHVDVRQLMRVVASGDFTGGYKILHKTLPFPGIVARTCEQPCQVKCHRADLGGAIRIADLELACTASGLESPPSAVFAPKKNTRVLIIGGGLSGLTAAFDLARKGYRVDLFEQGEKLGGRLGEFADERLPKEVLQKETSLVVKVGVALHLRERVEPSHPAWKEADAVYLGIGKLDPAFPLLDPAESGLPLVNPVTYQLEEKKVFAGGSLLHPFSSILSISDGRRAAISIDRFLQKVSLMAARVNESAYETRLFTSLAGLDCVEAVASSQPGEAYTAEQAQAEARRCLQCECMECVKACEYLKHYGSYPRKYVREIYNNMSMLVRARTSNNFINSCAICGLCAEICPNDLDMGQVCLETREKMVETSRMPGATHDFALRDMEFSNSDQFSLTLPPPGQDTCRYIFFPGCQLCGCSPHHVESAYNFLKSTLQEESAGVGLMLGCCGAPADWAGRKDLGAATTAQLRRQHEKLGTPTFVLACPSCQQRFKKYLPEVDVVSFWELFDRMGSQRLPAPPLKRLVSVHDPCSARYETGMQDAVRSVLRKAGCGVQELAFSREKTECCSFGGNMWLANRTVAEKMVQRRIQESPLDYVTYCAVCRDFFARRGKRAFHMFDLIFGEMGGDFGGAAPVGFSQRHENQSRLKEKYIKEAGGGMNLSPQVYKAVRIHLSNGVKEQAEERLILVEDIQKVIEHAESSGKCMVNPSSRHTLASFKPGSVTYWVEYSPQNDGSFHVHKVYSHRMDVHGGFGEKQS